MTRKGSISQMNPPFGKRKWIKLWTTEWLDGTTRYQMTGAQRAFWVDLLAMAGASRFPGVICAGKDGDEAFVGYPLSRFQALMSEPIDVAATLELFERTGKIKIETTSDGPPKAVKIVIVNWDKYQSHLLTDAERAKRYREKKKGSHADSHGASRANVTRVTGVEVEGEVEGDGEGDKEEAADRASLVENEKRPNAASENLTAAAAFSAIGFEKPVGNPTFQTLLVGKYEERTGIRETRTDFLEAVLQECQSRGVGVPPQVYAMKRRLEQADQAEIHREGDGALSRGGRN
jgi:hypothetical protein